MWNFPLQSCYHDYSSIWCSIMYLQGMFGCIFNHNFLLNQSWITGKQFEISMFRKHHLCLVDKFIIVGMGPCNIKGCCVRFYWKCTNYDYALLVIIYMTCVFKGSIEYALYDCGNLKFPFTKLSDSFNTWSSIKHFQGVHGWFSTIFFFSTKVKL
jgi:hypothetical protein